MRRTINFLNRLGIFGADGLTLASATNAVPVTPGTAAVWDVSDRLARLIGRVALNYDTPTSVAARYSGTSIPGAGTLLRTGKGVVKALYWGNGSAAAIPFMLFDATAQPVNGTVAIYATAVNVNAVTTVNVAEYHFTNGLYLAVTSGTFPTPTYTSIAGATTTISYSLLVQ